MRFNPKRLRSWFGYSALAVVVIVAAFYLYARIRLSTCANPSPDRQPAAEPGSVGEADRRTGKAYAGPGEGARLRARA